MNILTRCNNSRGSYHAGPDPQTRPKELPCTHQLLLFQLEWQQDMKVKLTVLHCVHAAKNAGVRATLVQHSKLELFLSGLHQGKHAQGLFGHVNNISVPCIMFYTEYEDYEVILQ